MTGVDYLQLKALMPITFSSPRAQPEVVYCLISMKAHIFLIANPKFQLQILCRFGDITKSVTLIGIQESIFLCIFIIASSPEVHTFFCLWGGNKKLPQGETSQNAFQRSRSINNMHIRMGISTFNNGNDQIGLISQICGLTKVAFSCDNI